MSYMPAGDRYLTPLAILFSVVALGVYSLYIQPWMLDDAFIAFRYAENIVAGDGPVFNVGERVEGYTSFLWMILLALGRLSGADIVIFSKVLGLAFAVGNIILLANAHRFIRAIDSGVSVIATLLLGSTGIFLAWGVSGMEVTLFTFLISLSLLYYISITDSDDYRKFSILGVLCGIMSLARPEGLLVTGILILYQSYRSIKKGNYPVAYLVVFFLIIYLPYFWWRYNYYGFLLPNTFYAKVGWNIDQVIRGLRYLVRFGIPSLMILLPMIDPIGISAWFKKYGKLTILPLVAAVYSIYIISVGGDSMPAFRFFTPIMPIFCILSAMTIMLIDNKRIVTLMVLGAIVYSIVLLNSPHITPHIEGNRTAEYGKEVGQWLAENIPADAVIATNTAGSVSYYSRLRVIDMLGLTDLHIAHREMPNMGSGWAGHEKADGQYVLSRKPDYIHFCSSLGSAEPKAPSDKEIYNIPEFHKRYVLKQITLPSGNRLSLYERRRELDRSPSDDDPRSVPDLKP